MQSLPSEEGSENDALDILENMNVKGNSHAIIQYVRP